MVDGIEKPRSAAVNRQLIVRNEVLEAYRENGILNDSLTADCCKEHILIDIEQLNSLV
jgi:hypothetical protein